MNERMQATEKHSAQLEDALSAGVLKRLPLTFLPFVNQQLVNGNTSFPTNGTPSNTCSFYVASLNETSLQHCFATLSHSKTRWVFATGNSPPPNRPSRTPLNSRARPISRNGAGPCRPSLMRLTAARNKRRQPPNRRANRLVLLDLPQGPSPQCGKGVATHGRESVESSNSI